MRTIRVLLADDHALVRAGIRSLLERLDGIEVVAEAGDGHETLRLASVHHPDVVLMDIGMPGLNGLEAAGRLTKEGSSSRVLVLSMHTSEEYVLKALRSGAAGYLIKASAASELEAAIRAVARGETYLSPSVSKYVVDQYVRRTAADDEPLSALTPRQREILQMIAEGNTSKDIARKLNLSHRTVETHRAQLMERLDVHDLAGLVLFAVRVGLVEPRG
ncbi:MAG TPA: response regulator transcription factor [Thermoanaerobaculia bacterium]|nr:response regulator transcription factor [Thermoanaerobaculia bacterium]